MTKTANIDHLIKLMDDESDKVREKIMNNGGNKNG